MPVPSESKSFTSYVKIAQFIAQFGFFSTTFFCFILIFLTVFGMTRNFGSYKYLLILFPTVGIFFATIELLLYPYRRPFGMSQDAVTLCLCFYTGVYASTISMLSVQFLYRYWAIFDEKKLRFFKGWKFMISVVYSLFFGVAWSLGILYFDKIDDYLKEYFNSDRFQKFNLDISEVSGVAFVAYDATGSIRWFNISSTTNMTCIMAIQYTFFFTIYLPLLDIECDLTTGITPCAVALYPAMDAIIVMCIVSDYKKDAKSKLAYEYRMLSVHLSELTIQFLDKCLKLLGMLKTEPSTNQKASTNLNYPNIVN
ncbi:hypothetical protein CRE_12965 [Caenorhabditis remanei]|uniref:Uncharacterized protein n=1 Tax=Caenorhabditis remanei TaxID=31234 RepID=E3N106_CAERE|nr:hypothetical protein CRE_12965 [Caenorhabditis remanei]